MYDDAVTAQRRGNTHRKRLIWEAEAVRKLQETQLEQAGAADVFHLCHWLTFQRSLEAKKPRSASRSRLCSVFVLSSHFSYCLGKFWRRETVAAHDGE